MTTAVKAAPPAPMPQHGHPRTPGVGIVWQQPPTSTRARSMGHQAAHRAARKQFAGHTAEHSFAKAAMSIRAGDDQVSSLLLRDLDRWAAPEPSCRTMILGPPSTR